MFAPGGLITLRGQSCTPWTVFFWTFRSWSWQRTGGLRSCVYSIARCPQWWCTCYTGRECPKRFIRNLPWSRPQNLSICGFCRFRSAVSGTYDARWPRLMGPNWEDFTQYEAGTNPDDYISFSTPSTRSSYLQLTTGPWRACSSAISLRHKDIFGDGS